MGSFFDFYNNYYVVLYNPYYNRGHLHYKGNNQDCCNAKKKENAKNKVVDVLGWLRPGHVSNLGWGFGPKRQPGRGTGQNKGVGEMAWGWFPDGFVDVLGMVLGSSATLFSGLQGPQI